MRPHLLALPLLMLVLALPAAGQDVHEPPQVVLRGIPFQMTIAGGSTPSEWWEVRDATGAILAAGTVLAGSEAVARDLVVDAKAQLPLSVVIGSVTVEVAPTLTSGWFSILPPLLAIVLALLFREVVTALFAGVWLGALAVAGFDPIAATGRVTQVEIVTSSGHDIPQWHAQGKWNRREYFSKSRIR